MSSTKLKGQVGSEDKEKTGSDGKESARKAGDPGFDPWVGKVPWRREWQPTPIFLPEEFQGQRSLVGCSPWGRKELETNE